MAIPVYTKSCFIEYLELQFKEIVRDSNYTFLCHESEDINKKGYFWNFIWFQFYIYNLRMIMSTGIAP